MGLVRADIAGSPSRWKAGNRHHRTNFTSTVRETRTLTDRLAEQRSIRRAQNASDVTDCLWWVVGWMLPTVAIVAMPCPAVLRPPAAAAASAVSALQGPSQPHPAGPTGAPGESGVDGRAGRRIARHAACEEFSSDSVVFVT
jgi:hypothetical protein